MSKANTRLEALAFAYHVIHSLEGPGKQWMRSLTPGQVQDLADVMAWWERTKHPHGEPVAHCEIIPLRELERRAILQAVDKIGAPLKAAAALGIGKTTLYRKLREYATDSLKIPPQRVFQANEENSRASSAQEG